MYQLVSDTLGAASEELLKCRFWVELTNTIVNPIKAAATPEEADVQELENYVVIASKFGELCRHAVTHGGGSVACEPKVTQASTALTFLKQLVGQCH